MAPREKATITILAYLLDEEEMPSSLPEAAVLMLRLMADMLAELDERIAMLDREIAAQPRKDGAARRLMIIPGPATIAVTAIVAPAPPVETVRKSPNFAAWLGLCPDSTRLAANSGSEASRQWASAPPGDC